MENPLTRQEYFATVALCRDIFTKKLHDYGASWRLLRIPSLTDQLLIKARRIRTLETSPTHMVEDGIPAELTAIANYCVIGLIQWELPPVLEADLSEEQAVALYDEKVLQTYTLMTGKNHDYGEAWRSMRLTSFTDLILTKLMRIKQLEDLQDAGGALVSENIDANYADILNYAIFALIRIGEADNE